MKLLILATNWAFAVVAVLLTASCSGSKQAKVSPPFMPDGQIVAHELAYIQTEPAGMTGHQQIFASWRLDSTEQAIDLGTSSNRIRDKLFWLKGRTDQLNQSLEFFEAYENYKQFKPGIVDILNDPELRYAYTKFRMETGRVVYVGIWVCSPKTKKIAFLSAD